MAIRVEFFGIARQRAGVASAEVSLPSPATLGDCLAELAGHFPSFAKECIEQRRLKPAFAANIGGQRFVSTADAPLADGDTLLILSADAGG